jgi:hypothetical protein
MLLKKKISVACTLVTLVILGIAAATPPAPIYKNLKVLPKNTTHEELDSVMHLFNTALGVRCNFCHGPSKDNPRKTDFAADNKPEKEIARDMMRMTTRINKKFFNYKPNQEHPVPPVGCVTCHHGSPHPATQADKKETKTAAPAPAIAPAQAPAQP